MAQNIQDDQKGPKEKETIGDEVITVDCGLSKSIEYAPKWSNLVQQKHPGPAMRELHKLPKKWVVINQNYNPTHWWQEHELRKKMYHGGSFFGRG